MKQKSLAVILFLTTFYAARAQQRGGGSAPSTKPSAAKAVSDAAVFLGSTSLSGGSIPDRAFDSLAVHPLTARDKAGHVAQVTGYSLTFAERGIAEDSAGNPILTIDYYTELCTGDTLNTVLRNVLLERTKPGDTVWYDRIQVATAAGRTGGKSMKFVISR